MSYPLKEKLMDYLKSVFEANEIEAKKIDFECMAKELLEIAKNHLSN